MVRAKFKVKSITTFEGDTTEVELSAVCADEVPENLRYHKYTPCGGIQLSVDNHRAAEQFIPGKMMYVDFTPIVDPVAEPSPTSSPTQA